MVGCGCSNEAAQALRGERRGGGEGGRAEGEGREARIEGDAPGKECSRPPLLESY